MSDSDFCTLEERGPADLLRLGSGDGTNRLSLARVRALGAAVAGRAARPRPRPLVIAGNGRFFSAGADLNEIARLGSDAWRFARAGQRLMNTIGRFPAPVVAAIEGYCMGGGLDLALACHMRLAAPNAVFGHRGAALGIMTGWGGTQRLPRLLGPARAKEAFLLAQVIPAEEALRIGLVDQLAEDPVEAALARLQASHTGPPHGLWT